MNTLHQPSAALLAKCGAFDKRDVLAMKFVRTLPSLLLVCPQGLRKSRMEWFSQRLGRVFVYVSKLDYDEAIHLICVTLTNACSAHGDLTTESASNIAFTNGHLKIVYHKEGVGSHAFRFSNSTEQAENPYGAFVTPTIISW